MNSFPALMTQKRILVDVGTSHLKVILQEAGFRKKRILQHLILDLHEEGIISPEEVDLQLQALLRDLGDYPVILVVPEHITISKIVDLPGREAGNIEERISAETLDLSGLGDSCVLHAYHLMKPCGGYQHPCWVTVAREADILACTRRIGTAEVNLAGITTPSNALIAAWMSTNPDQQRIVLVDVGATTTIVAVIDGGQGRCATSYPIGGEYLTEAVANTRGCSFDEAETLKRTRNIFTGDPDPAPVQAAMRTWIHELERVIAECFDDPEIARSSFPPLWVQLSGGASEQPGFLDYLREHTRLEIQTWPRGSESGQGLPLSRLAVAYGAGQQFTRRFLREGSLLPTDIERTRRKQNRLYHLNKLCLVTFILLTGLLVFGTLQKLDLILEKERLLQEADAAMQKVAAVAGLDRQRLEHYGSIYPIIEKRKKSADILQTLRLLQRVRAQRPLWWILLADYRSYTNGGSTLPADLISETNALRRMGARTNSPPVPVRPVFSLIAEATIPGKPENSLSVLGEVVSELQASPLFTKVDRLPADQKVSVVDFAYSLSNVTYALKLDLAGSGLEPPVPGPAYSVPSTNGVSRTPSPGLRIRPVSRIQPVPTTDPAP